MTETKLSVDEAAGAVAAKWPPPPGRRRPKGGAAQWFTAILLILVSAIPIAVGIYLLFELTTGHVRPENARLFDSPVPVFLHVVAAALYAIFGAFQFVATFRRRFPGWHRAAGRILVGCGLVAALTGAWVTLFYPRLPDTNDLLFVLRLVFTSAMVAFLVLGFTAIRRRDVPRHRAWMMRAFALGLGAGTQALVFMVVEMTIGRPDQLGKSLLMGASWGLNLMIAELVIRRRAGSRTAAMGRPA
jgi:uncharacterized membrane protein YozB (DUF420 family)